MLFPLLIGAAVVFVVTRMGNASDDRTSPDGSPALQDRVNLINDVRVDPEPEVGGVAVPPLVVLPGGAPSPAPPGLSAQPGAAQGAPEPDASGRVPPVLTARPGTPLGERVLDVRLQKAIRTVAPEMLV